MDARIIPVTDFRNRIKEILEQVKTSTIILTQRSHPAAVVMDYETYQNQKEKLIKLETLLDNLMLQQAMITSKEMVSLDELFTDYEKETGNKLA